MTYLILGASAAGISAAGTIRRLDPAGEITVISKDDQVYSRCMLHLVISGDRSPAEISFVEKDFWERCNIRWLPGREAVKLDTKKKIVAINDGREYRYDRLLIATGASSFLPPVENLARGKQVFVLRNMGDALEISRMAENVNKAVVIGAGLVGMEAAYALARRGIGVSVIEIAPNILPLQLDLQAALRYEQLCREHGMEFYLNEMVGSVSLDEGGNVLGVHLKSGKFVPCRMVIVAAGVRPNVDFLKDSPIEIDRGIKVNAFQQTSVPDVYAAGDVCESFEMFTGKVSLTPIWPAAVKQGQVAGCNMAGVAKRMDDNFAFKNSMTIFGLPAVSFGFVNPPDHSYQELVWQDAAIYRKFIVKDRRIRGAILQGDISNAGLIGTIIKDGIDICADVDQIWDLNYAFFFSQKDNGEFNFAK